MSLKIKWVGPLEDSSGYAQNSRAFVHALHKYADKKDLQLSVHAVSFEEQRADHGEAGKIAKLLSKVQMNEDVRIINTTPEFYKKLKGECCNIAYTTFETDRIPDLWVRELNKMDGVIATAEWCVDVFKKSGVTKPVFSVPPGIFEEECEIKKPVNRLGIPPGCYSFYSIFQWTSRKYPEGLLKAYWAEFEKNDDVVLVLKTYKNDTSKRQQEELRKLIQFHRQNFRLSRYPKIMLIPDLLSRQQILDIHLSGDCFVLPHRAEGNGLPHFLATCYGKPVITTGWSGNMEFTKPEFSYLIDYQMTPVSGMGYIPWYEGTMNWAEPDLCHLRKLMRYVYENRAEAEERGKKGREFVMREFSWEKQVDKLIRAVQTILEGTPDER